MSLLSIAPMIDWTNTHFRVFMRMLAPKALLYTEMQTAGALFNNPNRALQYHKMEHPLALQLGGSNVNELVQCARLAEEAGFDEINLNLGCPSDRVQAGRFGACMMAEPDLVGECIAAMKKAVSIPVTAKTRIGIDKQDSYEFFSSFAHCLVDAGIDKLIVHARKAWLKGLNPKQNRTIPPVHYSYVYQIREEIPHLPIVINGSINNVDEIKMHLSHVSGVMLGRLACQNPYAIAKIHQHLYPKSPVISRMESLKNYIPYLFSQQEKGIPYSILIKPLIALPHGLSGAKAWKEKLIKGKQGNQSEVFTELLEEINEMESGLRLTTV